MVRLVIEPLRLQNLFHNSTPLRNQRICPIKFTPLNAQVNYLSPFGDLMILAHYNPYYFYKYDCEAEETFVAQKELIKLIKCGFRVRRNEFVTFKTDKEHAYIEGDEGFEKITIPQVENIIQPSKFEPKLAEDGLMPSFEAKVLPVNIHAFLGVDQLQKGFPKSKAKNDQIVLRWNGRKIVMYVSTKGFVHSQKLRVKQYSVEGEHIVAYFDKGDFLDVVNRFCGEVWFGIGKCGMIISDSNSDRKLTYVLRAKKVVDIV